MAGREVEQVLVRLECLGCGDMLAARGRRAAGPGAADARRLPDGSLIDRVREPASARTCWRAAAPQMVAVRLW